MVQSDAVFQVFKQLVLDQSDDASARWFVDAIDFDADTFDSVAFSVAFAAATRQVGNEPVSVDSELERHLEKARSPIAPRQWPMSEVARAGMILYACIVLPIDRHVQLLNELFYRGDNLEKQAVLRALILLPEPARFLQLGVDACRAHVQTVFEAVACDNPYPAAHFSDMQFNQMVLKALFTGAAIERIANWKLRNNPELVRMAGDFADERRAARRLVPPDIQKIIDQAQER